MSMSDTLLDKQLNNLTREQIEYVLINNFQTIQDCLEMKKIQTFNAFQCAKCLNLFNQNSKDIGICEWCEIVSICYDCTTPIVETFNVECKEYCLCSDACIRDFISRENEELNRDLLNELRELREADRYIKCFKCLTLAHLSTMNNHICAYCNRHMARLCNTCHDYIINDSIIIKCPLKCKEKFDSNVVVR